MAKPSISCYRPYGDLTAAKHFPRLALSGNARTRPRMINVDGHPAYARAIQILEQDHRFIKKRIAASLWFRSAEAALNTIDGYEAMNMIWKGPMSDHREDRIGTDHVDAILED